VHPTLYRCSRSTVARALLCQDLPPLTPTLPQVLTLSRDQFTEILGSLQELKNTWRLEALRKVGTSGYHC